MHNTAELTTDFIPKDLIAKKVQQNKTDQACEIDNFYIFSGAAHRVKAHPRTFVHYSSLERESTYLFTHRGCLEVIYPELIQTTILINEAQAKNIDNYSQPIISPKEVSQITSQDKSISIDDIEEIKSFFEKIINSQQKNKMASLELIYDKFYALFKDKKYSLANYILKNVPVEKLELTCCLAFLTTTLIFKSQLSIRKELFESINKLVLDKFPDRAESLLKGLK